jgi:hypothetical protein
LSTLVKVILLCSFLFATKIEAQSLFSKEYKVPNHYSAGFTQMHIFHDTILAMGPAFDQIRGYWDLHIYVLSANGDVLEKRQLEYDGLDLVILDHINGMCEFERTLFVSAVTYNAANIHTSVLLKIYLENGELKVEDTFLEKEDSLESVLFTDVECIDRNTLLFTGYNIDSIENSNVLIRYHNLLLNETKSELEIDKTFTMYNLDLQYLPADKSIVMFPAVRTLGDSADLLRFNIDSALNITLETKLSDGGRNCIGRITVLPNTGDLYFSSCSVYNNSPFQDLRNMDVWHVTSDSTSEKINSWTYFNYHLANALQSFSNKLVISGVKTDSLSAVQESYIKLLSEDGLEIWHRDICHTDTILLDHNISRTIPLEINGELLLFSGGKLRNESNSHFWLHTTDTLGNLPYECATNFSIVDSYPSSDRIKVYPNPTDNFICIEALTSRLNSILLVDVNGRTVYSKTLNSQHVENGCFNLNGLAMGVYTCIVQNEHGERIYYEQFIVKR